MVSGSETELQRRPRFVIRTVYEKIDTQKEGTHD